MPSVDIMMISVWSVSYLAGMVGPRDSKFSTAFITTILYNQVPVAEHKYRLHVWKDEVIVPFPWPFVSLIQGLTWLSAFIMSHALWLSCCYYPLVEWDCHTAVTSSAIRDITVAAHKGSKGLVKPRIKDTNGHGNGTKWIK